MQRGQGSVPGYVVGVLVAPALSLMAPHPTDSPERILLQEWRSCSGSNHLSPDVLTLLQYIADKYASKLIRSEIHKDVTLHNHSHLCREYEYSRFSKSSYLRICCNGLLNMVQLAI